MNKCKEALLVKYYKEHDIFYRVYDDERELKDVVMEFLQALPQTKVIRIAIGIQKGVSDLIVCYKGKFVALELKARLGKASKQQLKFIREVEGAGGTAVVCYTLSEVYDALQL